jgi:hypothetical protein
VLAGMLVVVEDEVEGWAVKEEEAAEEKVKGLVWAAVERAPVERMAAAAAQQAAVERAEAAFGWRPAAARAARR